MKYVGETAEFQEKAGPLPGQKFKIALVHLSLDGFWNFFSSEFLRYDSRSQPHARKPAFEYGWNLPFYRHRGFHLGCLLTERALSSLRTENSKYRSLTHRRHLSPDGRDQYRLHEPHLARPGQDDRADFFEHLADPHG